MPSVQINDRDSFDVALRRFKRACEKAGIPTKLRQQEFYEKPTSKRKRRRAAAIKRYHKKLLKEGQNRFRDHVKRQRVIHIPSDATTAKEAESSAAK